MTCQLLISLNFCTREALLSQEIILSAAAREMNPEFMRYLLQKCDPAAMKCYPLLTAAGNSAQVVDIFLGADMSVNFQSNTPEFIDPFVYDPAAINPLHVSAEKGKLDVASLLLERGARTDLKDSYGRTAEVITTKGGYSNIAQLINSCAKCRKVCCACWRRIGVYKCRKIIRKLKLGWKTAGIVVN